MRRGGTTAAAVGVLPGVTGAARAQEAAIDLPPADRWTFLVAPYLWAISLDGNAGVRSLEADLDVPFSDAVKDLSVDGDARAARNAKGQPFEPDERQEAILLKGAALGELMTRNLQVNPRYTEPYWEGTSWYKSFDFHIPRETMSGSSLMSGRPGFTQPVPAQRVWSTRGPAPGRST